MLPTSAAMPRAAAGKRTLEALRADERPKLCLWADSDPILRSVERAVRGGDQRGAAGEDRRDASHFLQEDAGEEIGRKIVAWLARPRDGILSRT